MRNILKQGIKFIFISGMGFLIDFFVFCFLTKFLNIQIVYANVISAIPATTYVFFVSIKNVFKKKKSKVSIKQKYLIYFTYQIILVVSVSVLAQIIYNNIIEMINTTIVINNIKILVKMLITPITMTCNFFVMKILSEKL